MEKMKDLKDLLIHEIQDLYSAEEQIIEALPTMIEKAKDAKLVSALKEHLKVTEQQKKRLDEVKQLLMGESDENSDQEEKKGFFSSFFSGGSPGKQVCKGMQGLIEEGNKVMGEEMNPSVLDAAIIACTQKIEHYEICGYGTARAYARELNLKMVAERLEKTLNEEYKADDLLTALAVGGGLNEEAEMGSLPRRRSRLGSSSSKTKSKSKTGPAAKKSTGTKKSSSTPRKSPKGSLRTNKSASPGKSRSKSAPASRGKKSASWSSKSRGR